MSRFSPTIQKGLEKIIKRYPLKSGQCRQCAQKMLALFAKEGFHAQIGHMETFLPVLTLADGTYLSHRPRGSSSLAYHEFVRLGDYVYDSITGAQGMHWDDYQKLFYEGVFDDGTIRLTYS